MPSRNQSMIRRDINRLYDTIERHGDSQKSLVAIQSMVASSAEQVNRTWQNYQTASVAGDKERQERDESVQSLLNWIQRWRPVLLLLVPGAETNLRQLPPTGATPDDVIRVAEDMSEFISANPGTDSFRAEAIESLGDMVEMARKETSEASAALPAEAAARQAYSEACIAANSVLVRGTEVVRAIFGRTSPEYKQFIARASSANGDDGIEDTGEDEPLSEEETVS